MAQFLPASARRSFVPVANLRKDTQVKSYQFRVEITPIGGAQPISGTSFQTLTVNTNDFVPLKTAAAGNSSLGLPGQPDKTGTTRGLAVSTENNGDFAFNKFAVVALLEDIHSRQQPRRRQVFAGRPLSKRHR